MNAVVFIAGHLQTDYTYKYKGGCVYILTSVDAKHHGASLSER